MRISDWSSDVCSSDLVLCRQADAALEAEGLRKSRALHRAGEEVARHLVERPERFDLSHRDRQRPRTIGEIDIGQFDRIVREIGLDAIGKAAGNLAVDAQINEIGRASCRERVCPYVEIAVVAGSLNKTNRLQRSVRKTKEKQLEK